MDPIFSSDAMPNPANELPSPNFVKAVAELLETDAEDLLTELGYSEPSRASATILEV
jgi:hypothetical protein